MHENIDPAEAARAVQWVPLTLTRQYPAVGDAAPQAFAARHLHRQSKEISEEESAMETNKNLATGADQIMSSKLSEVTVADLLEALNVHFGDTKRAFSPPGTPFGIFQDMPVNFPAVPSVPGIPSEVIWEMLWWRNFWKKFRGLEIPPRLQDDHVSVFEKVRLSEATIRSADKSGDGAKDFLEALGRDLHEHLKQEPNQRKGAENKGDDVVEVEYTEFRPQGAGSWNVQSVTGFWDRSTGTCYVGGRSGGLFPGSTMGASSHATVSYGSGSGGGGSGGLRIRVVIYDLD